MLQGGASSHSGRPPMVRSPQTETRIPRRRGTRPSSRLPVSLVAQKGLDEVRYGAHAELAHETRPVQLDSLGADAEHIGNRLVELTGDHQLHDLALAPSEGCRSEEHT